MNTPADLEITLQRLQKVLSQFPLRYHCTGGLVASMYGEPRFTQDIDIVINFEEGESLVANFLAGLATVFMFDKDAAQRAIEHHDMFQALDLDHFIKIDFHVGEAVTGELFRSHRREIMPGIEMPIVSKEDAILSKLLWIKKGSEKSRRDVIMMLRGPDPINWPELTDRAAGLGVNDLLVQLQKEASA